jgi:hypothetical protein
MDLSRLEVAIRQAWGHDTSASGKFDSKNPARGQCAVTAVVFQDYVGGKIVWDEVVLPNDSKESHYFNKIEAGISGTEYDLTRLQFPIGTEIGIGEDKKKGFNSTREYILSYEATRKRYEILSERVAKLLED